MAIPRSTKHALRCKYNQTICYNERAYKLSGGRHKLCAYHRENANAAQRRFTRKQREKRQPQHLRSHSNVNEDEQKIEIVNQIYPIHGESDLTFEISDLIPLDEMINDDWLIDNITSKEGVYEWLSTAFR